MVVFYFVLTLSGVALLAAWALTVYTKKKRMKEWSDICEEVKKTLSELESSQSWKTVDEKDVPEAVNKESDWLDSAPLAKVVKPAPKIKHSKKKKSLKK